MLPFLQELSKISSKIYESIFVFSQNVNKILRMTLTFNMVIEHLHYKLHYK